MSTFSVLAPRRFVRLARADALNVLRDPMLVGATCFSVLPAIAFWAFEAQMNAAALDAFGIAGFSRFAAPLVLLLPALLIGWVAGFLLLEDRDDGPLLALDVTPPGKLGFLAYRLAAAGLLTGIITAAFAPVLMPGSGLVVAATATVLVALAAMATALILPVIARNKVEGLALSKLVNIAMLVPLLALVPSPLRYLGGVIPTYWLGELLLPVDGPLPLWLLAALSLAVNAVAVAGLAVLLGRRMG